MASDFRRASISDVQQNPRGDAYYVLVVRFLPDWVDPENPDPFHAVDQSLAPSAGLFAQADELCWDEWTNRFRCEIEDHVHERAAVHSERAGARDCVFVCYCATEAKCHTGVILDQLGAGSVTTLEEFF